MHSPTNVIITTPKEPERATTRVTLRLEGRPASEEPFPPGLGMMGAVLIDGPFKPTVPVDIVTNCWLGADVLEGDSVVNDDLKRSDGSV